MKKLVTAIMLTAFVLMSVSEAGNKQKENRLHQAHSNASKQQVRNAATHPEKGKRAHKLSQQHSSASRQQIKRAVNNPNKGRKAHQYKKQRDMQATSARAAGGVNNSSPQQPVEFIPSAGTSRMD